MWFYIPAAIFLVLFAIWFSRTNTFRHQFRGNGKIPGQEANHAEPYYDSSQRYLRKPD